MTYRTLMQAGFASTILVLTGTALAMGPGGGGACGGGSGGQQGGGDCGECSAGAFNAVEVVALSDSASSELLKMREEEKLARDVYAALGDKWDSPVFQITNAEQKHMDGMKKMLDRFGMIDPVTDDAAGVFGTEAFDVLYNELVESGSESLLDALKVGAKIEELDLVDLRAAIADVEDPILTKVYGNLQRATRNHLRAFAAQIEANGGSYEAEHLSQTEFDTIAASDFERGHGAGQGKGKAQDNALGQGNMKQGKGKQGTGQGSGQGCGLCKG